MFFKTFKKNFFRVFIVDVIFLGFLVLLGYFARIKLKSYLTAVQSFSPALSQIQESDVNSLEQVLLQLNTQLNAAYLFLFLIIPVISFLLYVFFQSLSWNLILSSFQEHAYKKMFQGYLKNSVSFFLFHVIPFTALILFLYFYSLKGFSTSIIFVSLICLLVLFYIAFVFSLASFQHSLKKSFKEGLVFMKKVMVFPVFLVLILFSVLFLGSATLLYFRVWSLLPFLILDIVIIELLRFYLVSLFVKKV